MLIYRTSTNRLITVMTICTLIQLHKYAATIKHISLTSQALDFLHQ